MKTLLQRLPPAVVAALFWVPPLTLYGAISWLSHQPQLPAPGSVVGDFMWFKTAHFVVYGVLTFLVWLAWRAQLWKSDSIVLATWYTLCIAASLDELHQRFVPGRGSRPLDVFIDLLAAWAVLQVVARYNEA